MSSDEDFEEEVTSGSEYSPDDSDLSDSGPRQNRPNKRNRTTTPAAKKRRLQPTCNYKEKCYRKNPDHFREFSHPHLEKILAEYSGSGNFAIPAELQFQKSIIEQQLSILKSLSIYPMSTASTSSITSTNNPNSNSITDTTTTGGASDNPSTVAKVDVTKPATNDTRPTTSSTDPSTGRERVDKEKIRGPQSQVPKKEEDVFNVVAPKGKMAEKHEKAAPFYIFFTTITAAKDTHMQPLSITFQELLDRSLGRLESSLQINFMVDIGWLLAQYYFAGYNNKPLTILYGDDSPDLKNITEKKPNVKAFLVPMKNPFGKHHTKMSILSYEDGSLRVVISTANLYVDDWENRTQGLWISPNCPKLANPIDIVSGESPTGFKRSLLDYLKSYSMPCLNSYIEKVKQADFSSINVFFIGSIPGSHFDSQWALTRLGSLLYKHSSIPENESDKWEFIAQASSLGSYGADPKLWLCGEFQSNFCKSIKKSPMMSKLPRLKLIYPSLTNVKNSHDDLLGGGCLPYSKSIHEKQPWLNKFLCEWSAMHSGRHRAMPHIKSYLRISPDHTKSSYFLLTSANASKAAWGTLNKGNGALRVNSYEVGVLFLPKFTISEEYFSLELSNPKRIPIPYDLPPIPYDDGDIPWVMDNLH